jgi:predicted enzyme related to lactoylglutathione lyase
MSKFMIKYGYTILYVVDVERTVAFYSTAFGFTKKFITPEKDYAEMVTGETVLAFASIALGESNIKKRIYSKLDHQQAIWC